MKIKNYLSIFAIVLMFTLPLKSFAAWIKLPGAATDIGAGGSAIWVTGTHSVNGGYNIYRWSWHDWELVEGGAVNIAVSPTGQPWVVNNSGEIFHKTGSWHKMPGAAHDISVGGFDQVWVIGMDRTPGGYQIFHWNGVRWDMVEGGGVRIAVDPQGNPWIVNDQGSIYHLFNGHWLLLPGKATDIAIGRNGMVWVIGNDKQPGGYGIYRWTGGNWEPVEGAGVRIAVDRNGNPWVVNENGEIFKYRPDHHSTRTTRRTEFRISF